MTNRGWPVACLIVTILISCGTRLTGVCTLATCDGCCLPNGECRPGNVDDECGIGASSCSNCGAGAAFCVSGICSSTPPGPDGGSSSDGGRDGGTIGPDGGDAFPDGSVVHHDGGSVPPDGGSSQSDGGCVSESDSVFCAALQKNCGTLSATDNCGSPRIANCGTCVSPETCGGGGVSNVCGCTPLTARLLCDAMGWTLANTVADKNPGTTSRAVGVVQTTPFVWGDNSGLMNYETYVDCEP